MDLWALKRRVEIDFIVVAEKGVDAETNYNDEDEI